MPKFRVEATLSVLVEADDEDSAHLAFVTTQWKPDAEDCEVRRIELADARTGLSSLGDAATPETGE